MNKIVDEIIAVLEGNNLIQNTSIVNYDETPSGRLEAKIRCQLPKSHNAPHYEHLSTAPHHFHDEDGNVSKSPLTGNIKRDLKIVLKEIANWMESEQQT
jgi:hypothetical protein